MATHRRHGHHRLSEGLTGSAGAGDAETERNLAEGAAEDSSRDPDASTTDAGDASDATIDRVGCWRWPDASFCVDFEAPNSLSTAVWTNAALTSPAGTISLSSVLSVSSSRSARFDLPDAASSCESLSLARLVNGGFSLLRLRAAVRLDVPSIFLVVNTGSTTPLQNKYALQVKLDPGSSVVLELKRTALDGGAVTEIGESQRTLALSPFGRWIDLVLEIVTSPTPRVARLTVDGVTLTPLALPGVELDEPYVALGPVCKSGSMTMHVDDVAIDAVP